MVAAIWLAGCGENKQSSPPQSTTLPSAQVQIQTVQTTPYPTTENAVGTVRPKLSAAIEAKVSGRIERMLVVPGQLVKAGELLVQLDAHEIQARNDQARASEEQAKQDWKRISTLYSQQAATRAEYDAAEARYRVAQGAAAEAKALLSYVDIRAPFNGVITRKSADVGDLAMPGKPLLQMENPEALRLEADVPETLVGQLKLGDVLAISINAVTNPMNGTVAEISPAADPNSRTFTVKLDLPAVGALRSGQFGRVAIPVSLANMIAVPSSAIVQRGQLELVFVVQRNQAQMRLVKTGVKVGNQTEVVSGLNAGESVVTEGAANLADGQPLTILQQP